MPKLVELNVQAKRAQPPSEWVKVNTIEEAIELAKAGTPLKYQWGDHNESSIVGTWINHIADYHPLKDIFKGGYPVFANTAKKTVFSRAYLRKHSIYPTITVMETVVVQVLAEYKQIEQGHHFIKWLDAAPNVYVLDKDVNVY